MKISELIKILDTVSACLITDDFLVRGISCNSKQVSKGFVFVAIRGLREDGNKFIQEALKNGARAIVIKSSRLAAYGSKKILFIKVRDTRRALARLAAEFYGNPSSKMKVAGITGTNGKTTVTYLIEAILKEAGFIPGVIGTINYRFRGRVIPAKNTTPGPLELQSMLNDMLKEGVGYCAMEVSSHALDQGRTVGIKFHSAVFTNLTQDHLDYHKTLTNYFNAKSRLFKGMERGSFAVINEDDRYARKLKKITDAETITYGIDNRAEVLAKKIHFDARLTKFLLVSPQGQTDIVSLLIGKHNIYNMLASAAWALKNGIDLGVVKSALQKFRFVPGRLEPIDFKGNFCVFVDYAHTQDGLYNVIRSLRQLTQKRIIVVFGCGGDRDKNKRPKMGRVVSELADYAIITNDNPRSEEPLEIIRQIKKGMVKDNYCVIPDRFAAIKKSLGMAKRGDIVLVAGKGHENCQVLKDRTIHFDDREAIRKCLMSMN